jgi:hypothetical protein
MKRKRRLTVPRRPSSLRVEEDAATDTTAARASRGSYESMKMPHERDEDTHAPGKPNEVTTQGARDVEQGKVDTDCYGAVGQRYDRTRGSV